MIAPPWGYRSDVGRCSFCLHVPPEPHRPGCRTAALESTVEAMARALEVEAIDDCACHCCVQRVARARAALASWRGLTGGERG